MASSRRLTVRPLIAAAALGTATLAGLAGGAVAVERSRAEAPQIATPGPADVARGGVHGSLSDMVEAVGPSVVQIRVEPNERHQQLSHPMQFGADRGPTGDDMGERLGRLFGFEAPEFGGQPQGRRPQGGALGSGFIIDASGLVITNNHVVEGATSVTVQLSDGRELAGRVLGRDPKTDLAVVRIEGGGAFKPIVWGDSDRIRVGESVFAVGSPFGLGNTVTSGIVSARGREIGAGPYDDFLQVDAAINSGNSGGPLFDASGRVVGVNTAIFSPSGGNVGIGFAIPARLARDVAQQIAEHGRVSRGRIGVALQDLTPEIVTSLGLDGREGVLIAGVDPTGPGAAAGLERGDVVRRFGTTAITDGGDLARAVADARIGSTVPLVISREGRELTLDLRIADDGVAQS